MIDTLFTDLGGVMFLFDQDRFVTEVSKRTTKNPSELLIHWDKSEVVRPSHTGKINGKIYLEMRARELGITPTEFIEIWDMISMPNEEYFTFLNEWKEGENKLYLLSNINVVAWNYYRRHPIFQIFDGLFLSYRLRLAKPDSRIFEVCLKKAGIKSEQTLFIDDLEENIATAKALDLLTWHYCPENHSEMLDFMKPIWNTKNNFQDSSPVE